MAFCKYCGTQLEEGALCGCEKAVAARAAQAPASEATPAPAPTATPVEGGEGQAPEPEVQSVDYKAIMENSGNIAKSLLQQILAVWKKPACAGSDWVKNGNHINALIFAGIQALLSGFVVMVIAGKINAALEDLIYLEEVKVSLGKAFFYPFFISVAIAALVFALLFVGAKIMKSSADAKMLLRLTATRSMAAIPFTLVGLIITLINPGVGLAICVVGAVIAYTFVLQGMEGLEDVNKNARGYFNAIVHVALVLIIMFVVSSLVKGKITELLSALSSLGGLF